MLKKPLDLLFQVKTLDASYGYGCEIGLTNKEASSHAFWGEKKKVSKDDVAYIFSTAIELHPILRVPPEMRLFPQSSLFSRGLGKNSICQKFQKFHFP